MELRRYLEILLRRKWVIIIVLIVTVEVVAVGSSLMTSVYEASTLVRIAQRQESSIDYLPIDYSERLINTNVRLLKSRPFLEEVILRLSLPISPAELSSRLSVDAVPNTELIQITAEGPTSTVAVKTADTLATLLIEEMENLFSGPGLNARESLAEQLAIVEEDLQENRALLQDLLADPSGSDSTISIQDLSTRIQVQEESYAMLINEYESLRIAEGLRANSVTIVEPAVEQSSPARPNIPLNVALSVVVGLSGGIGLAFLFDNLDSRIHSSDDLAITVPVPLLGRIPELPPTDETEGMGLVMETDVRSPESEAFRILRSNVLSLVAEDNLKTLVIASPEAGAGKSTVLANMAAAIAQGGRSVIVVDSDFGHPSLHKLFHLPMENGLSDVLFKLTSLESALKTTRVYGVQALTSGTIPSNPGDMLETRRLEELVGKMKNKADIVLFDSPPILAVADAAILAPLADGVLLVAARRLATKDTVKQAIHQLELVGANVVGTIFNRADAHAGGYYLSYYDRISQSKGAKRRPGLRQRFSPFKKKA